MGKLIQEYIPLSYDRTYVNEAIRKGNGTVQIKAILQRADAKNQNGRIYPRSILEREAAKYLEEFVKGRRAMGELDHPSDSVVNLRNVSHNIIEMHWEGDDLVGTLEILSTPSGNIVKELMKNGIQLGISSRGMGSVVNMDESTVAVDEDFNLICFDIVSNPSTQGAFLYENVQTSLNAAREDRLNGLFSAFFSELTNNQY
jgi:Prohead core protein serine protease